MLVFNELIAQAVNLHASDIHFTVGIPPTVRIDGELHHLGDIRCTPAEIEEMALSIMGEHHKETLKNNGEVDFAYSIPGEGRYRINVFRQRGTLAVAVRILNLNIPSPEELGLPKALVNMCQKKRGLVLVTGPTGAGKSTTLASLIDVINQTSKQHIITLEDPIEYLHRHNKSIVNQREMGSDSKNYANALRAALREDPDVLLVGEMRDLETISTAITAAETGHLVFGTLHTKGAVNTIDRIIDVFPADQQEQIRTQLADVIECAIGQALVPKVGGGRCAAFEIMVVNSAIRSLIRQKKTFQIVGTMQTNKRIGMQLLDDALMDLVRSGTISRHDAAAAANDPSSFQLGATLR